MEKRLAVGGCYGRQSGRLIGQQRAMQVCQIMRSITATDPSTPMPPPTCIQEMSDEVDPYKFPRL
eukprot:6396074-Amphidinium_carterae.1